ncbi:MAG: bifunctional NADH dehydrogenase FAD-containing subunit/selenide,water dikinase SelD [Pseudohongiella sp.]|nr:MAG: bifunctional NADH dehydrogenase FAD-containing subunit/selenide,water dikinase SelD [Pseudohongiella sp.]
MKPNSNSPIVKQLVLIGGGHSHLAVLKRFAMNPVPGLGLTLISRDIETPYSGSLPGHIAGIYERDEIHIDLRPLAQSAGARLIQNEITRIDFENKVIHCQDRPTIDFDLISLNIGSKPDAVKIPGASKFAIGIKPIDQFLLQWEKIHSQILKRIDSDKESYRFLIVGGGPASVELAFAVQQRIHNELSIKKYKGSPLEIGIVSADEELLKFHNSKVRQFLKAELANRSIEVLLEHEVVEFTQGKIHCSNEIMLEADSIIFATGASIPAWPKDCGLAIGEDGFIEVNDFLQSTSHDFVFAAGDAATIKHQPRPKSGVYAVRQGLPLAENLQRFATGRKLRPYSPQKHALALINLGNKRAIASRNNFFFQGRSVWSLKNTIDSAFIRKYSQFPNMQDSLDIAKGLLNEEEELKLRKHAMRCAGCGAKIAGDALQEVLQDLPHFENKDILSSGAVTEDAALIQLEDDRVLLQSVDQLSAFISDPWLFAKIASNHCLSDIYAMGCMPHSALAIVGVPAASKEISKGQLREIMQGCSEALIENECTLVGGHSAESKDLLFGLCVNGFSQRDALLGKDGMQTGDIIILCKPLGTGTLLAADMRSKAKHRWIDAALKQMLISNRKAAQCFVQHQATSCTDITGFGLAGHLFEMLEPNNVELELSLEDLPALDGALETLKQGILSSLHADNSLVSRDIFNSEAFRDNPRYDLLFDPQTAGGLLASVSEDQAEACIKQLRKSGYGEAKAIGRVSQTSAKLPALILK